MTKKYTKDDYFAAASALDAWDINGDITTNSRTLGVPCSLFDKIWNEAWDILFEELHDDYCDVTSLAVQIGCEKAGL